LAAVALDRFGVFPSPEKAVSDSKSGAGAVRVWAGSFHLTSAARIQFKFESAI